MDLIYTDTRRKDIGVLKDYSFDLAFGADENDFELTIDLPIHCCEINGLVYIEGTEYGGIIDGILVRTVEDKLTYRGRTWHGILASKVIEPNPGKAYLTVSGDVNTIISDLLVRLGLDDLFTVESSQSNILIDSYRFDRYIDAYTGLKKMLDSASCKLKFSYIGNSVVISASPIVDYSKDEQFDNDSVEMEFEKSQNTVNHLICLGKGELTERTVVHLYADASGNVSQKQTFFGVEEVTATYEYPTVESIEELVKNGTTKLQEYTSPNKVQMNFTPESNTFDIGDIIGAREIVTGTSASAKVTKKIVTINQGEVNIQYKVGE